ncbi:MAG: hypothetical protein ACXV3C_02990 [Actinomycetes bacterium]
MTNHASLPSEIEPGSLADLIADCAAVRSLLHLQTAPLTLPSQRELTIPEPALALVAGLDSYGD